MIYPKSTSRNEGRFMVSKILLVGSLSEEIRDIQQTLNKNKLYSVERVEDIRGAIHKMKNGIVHLALINHELLNKNRLSTTQLIRKEAYDVPIIMLARAISREALEESQRLSKVVVLEKPCESKELYGVTSKLISGEIVSQKIHRRFYTNQNTQIIHMGGVSEVSATMLNLSKGGAYVETSANIHLNGLVKMSVSLEDLSKTYEVNAKVVWSTPQGRWGQGQGVGLQFIHAKDIYRNLLSNLK